MIAKILVVDEYLDTRSIYRELLQMQGYEVCTAASGHEAIDCMQEHWPDLVIIDNDPGKMSGTSLVARLKQFAVEGKRTPVKAIAIRGDFIAERDALLPGFDYVMAKPLHFEQLDEVVRQCMLPGA